MANADEAQLQPLLAAVLEPRIGHAPSPWPDALRRTLARLADNERIGIGALLAGLVARPREPLVDALIDAATITHTTLFRHRAHFERLDRELRQRAGPVRMWSAGCASGEEPYSMALTAHAAGVPATVLATDVSHEALAIARRGRYSSAAAQRAGIAAAGGTWEVPEIVRSTVRFERASLIEPARGGPFDVVFCRNVLIYFDAEAGDRVIRRLLAELRPDGAIVVAPIEALRRLPAGLRRAEPLGWLERGAALTARPAPSPPPIAEDLLVRAARSIGMGALEDAEATLHAALEAAPSRAEAWFLLGELLERRGEPTQSRIAFERAAERADKTPEGITLANAALRRARAST